MKTLNKALLTLVAGTFLSMGAQAAVTDMAGQPYVGAKVGAFMPDDEGFNDLDNATAFGVYGGYNFNDKVGVEAEYLGSSDTDLDVGEFSGEYNLKTYGLYGTYRYQFENTPLFAKAKLGFANAEVEVDIAGSSASDDDTAIAGGLALGYNLSPMVDMQAEWAMIGGDVDTNILTLGASYKF